MHISENVCIKMCSFATEQPSNGGQHVALLRHKQQLFMDNCAICWC